MSTFARRTAVLLILAAGVACRTGSQDAGGATGMDATRLHALAAAIKARTARLRR